MKTELRTILGVGIALAALEGRMATSREIAVLRMDMNERLEASRTSTNESIAGLRRDFTSLRADVASLRGEVSKLGERVAKGRLDGWSLAVLGAQRSRTAPDSESRPPGAPKPR